MNETERYFQQFYNEVRFQIELGNRSDFSRVNQIWNEYQIYKTNPPVIQEDWWDCECGISNHPSWTSCQFCKYPRRTQCPTSPNHYHYFDDNKKLCVYCGQPPYRYP